MSTERTIKWGIGREDVFFVSCVDTDIDGEPCSPLVLLREGLCPDVWPLEPVVAEELARAIMAAAAAAKRKRTGR